MNIHPLHFDRCAFWCWCRGGAARVSHWSYPGLSGQTGDSVCRYPSGGQCVGRLLIYLLRASTCLAVPVSMVAVAFSRRWSYPGLSGQTGDTVIDTLRGDQCLGILSIRILVLRASACLLRKVRHCLSLFRIPVHC